MGLLIPELPLPALRAEHERLSRFQRTARVLAARLLGQAQVRPDLSSEPLIAAPSAGQFWTVCISVRRVPASSGGVRVTNRNRRNPASHAGLRLFHPAGAAGLEPATPGFGDRCSTN